MDANGRRAWVESVMRANAGTIDKAKLLGLCMAKGMNHTAAYDLINSLIALDVLRQLESAHPPRKVLHLIVSGP